MIPKESISNRLNITDFFDNISDIEYVIMRLDLDFPNYKYSDDIDILCSEPEKFIKNILNIVKEKYKDFKVNVNYGSGGVTHFHVDLFYRSETIDDFRFDIISNLSDFYKNLKIPNNYESVILKNKNKHTKYNVSIPNISHELSLRYMEYISKIKKKPKKIKHLEYIQKFPDISFTKFELK